MVSIIKGSEPSFIFEIKGAPICKVVGFWAHELISKPFVFEVYLASESKIDLHDMMEKEALLTIKGLEADRYFHGFVRKFENTGKSGKFKYLYTATCVPFTQLLSLEQDCRIFQSKDVQDIVKDIFKDSNIPSDRYDFRLMNKEHKRRYCIQYRETDLNFINRILQEEGIFYFYEHDKDKHVMVFADDPVGYQNISGSKEITFKASSGLAPEKEVIKTIQFSERLRPGTYTQTNYNFKTPSTLLETKEQSKDDKIKKYEIYDYPGQYGEQGRGGKLTKAHLQGNTTSLEQAKGTSNCPRLIPGHIFQLSGYDFTDYNKEYVLFSVKHSGQQPQALEEQATGGTNYDNSFLVIPAKTTYRPIKSIKKPYIQGIQSATVVGPQNSEIYCDEHGRVKVQFHWDRKGKKDDQSSCWLRCSQTWGGGGWGAVFIPRVGDEVLVSFMEGDPDWPIITGSVYNGANPPLYDLPANNTRTTIKTRSTPNSKGFNELRFEDKAGSEEVYLQGEKDWNILIKNDKGQNVGHDETLNVGNNRTKTVGVDQSETIGANKTITVGANHTEKIGGNKSETVTINCAETIGVAKELTIGGLYQVSVGGVMNETVGGAKTEEVILAKAVLVGNDMTEKIVGDRSINVGKNFNIDAGDSLTITCGKSTFRIDKDGNVTVNGAKLELSGADHVQFNGDIDFN